MFYKTDTPYPSPDHYLELMDGIFDLLSDNNKLDIIVWQNVYFDRFDIASYKVLKDDRYFWLGIIGSSDTNICVRLPTQESLNEFIAVHKLDEQEELPIIEGKIWDTPNY